MLCSYPLWAGERAISEGVVESKFVPPTPGILKPLLEGQVSTVRYVEHWSNAADATIKRLEGPRTPRLTMDELRAKYGPNWGIARGRKPPPTREQAAVELIAAIGQEAFDAIPDAGWDWKKDGDWVKAEFPPGQMPKSEVP